MISKLEQSQQALEIDISIIPVRADAKRKFRSLPSAVQQAFVLYLSNPDQLRSQLDQEHGMRDGLLYLMDGINCMDRRDKLIREYRQNLHLLEMDPAEMYVRREVSKIMSHPKNLQSSR